MSWQSRLGTDWHQMAFGICCMYARMSWYGIIIWIMRKGIAFGAVDDLYSSQQCIVQASSRILQSMLLAEVCASFIKSTCTEQFQVGIMGARDYHTSPTSCPVFFASGFPKT